MEIGELIPRASELMFADVVANSPEWHAERLQRIGGSEVAAIFGISKWATPLSVWREKTKREESSFNPRWEMEIGSHMESKIAKTWADEVGCTLFEVPYMYDKEKPWRAASLDRVCVFPGHSPQGVEIKWTSHPWTNIPDQYFCQIQWYLGITGLSSMWLVVAGPHQSPEGTLVQFDHEAFTTLCEQVDAFWNDNVLADVAPEPTTVEEMKAYQISRLVPGQAVEATADVIATVKGIEAQKEHIELLKLSISEKQASIAEWLYHHGASKVKGPGFSVSLVEKQGQISYADYVQTLNVDKKELDTYRGKPSKYIDIRKTKEN